MAEEGGTGSNAIWAVAMIIIVAIVAGVIYIIASKGVPGSGDKKIDVDVSVPSR